MNDQIEPTEMMAIQLETLFVHDQNGRLVGINSKEDIPAPRFFFGSTEKGNLWRFRCDLPDSTVDELESLCIQEPTCGNLRDAPINLETFKDILNKQDRIQHSWTGPAYWIPEGYPNSSANAVRITDDNVDLLKEGFPDIKPRIESCQPVFAVTSGGAAVSVCLSARITSKAHEAGVETLETHRGKGYASSVVGAWATEVRGLGRIPFYSTSWENIASQGVARRLRARMFGVDLHFT